MGASPFDKEESWDWPFILFVGRVWLCYREEEVWKLTPRKFQSQLDVYNEIRARQHGEAPPSEARDGFIDEVPGWA